jgi:hypothetical protein
MKRNIRPPRITPEIAEKIGEAVGAGVKLVHALAGQERPIPLNHWRRSLESGRDKAAVRTSYEAAVSRGVQALVKQVDPSNVRWQSAAWKLERVHGYATPKEASVNVAVFQTIAGVDESILRRARQMAHSRRSRLATRSSVKPIVDVTVIDERQIADKTCASGEQSECT